MHDFIQPYLNDVVSALLSLLAALVVAFFVGLRKKVNSYIDTHATAAQRQLLHTVAGEAVAYAGVVFKEQNGEQKLSNALTYVNAYLKPSGVSFTEAELRGAVEKAYAAFNAQSPTVDISVAPTEPPATLDTPAIPETPAVAPVEDVPAYYVAPAPKSDPEPVAQGGA